VTDTDADAVADGVATLGRLDIAVANAGVCSIQRWDEVAPEQLDAELGVNLTGVWNTCTAAIPHLLEADGGSMILISSTAGLKGQPFLTPYVASKHGMVGIMRSLANELAAKHIRVNSLHPTGVDTPMLMGMTGLTMTVDAGASAR
jgi:NAD(P)-dependent dehydrogenase (short-subunit alcohol dehydrogenase family)